MSYPKVSAIPYFHCMLHQRNQKLEMYFRVRALARKMRINATKAEDFFWEKVRNRKLFGLKFNRQFIIAIPIDENYTKYYIADFHCSKLRLIVELDGQIHLRQQEADMIRTDRLCEHGYTVMRFSNEQVLERWDEVEMAIRHFMESC